MEHSAKYTKMKNDIKKSEKRAKLGLYLTTNHVFSYHGITDFVYIATRGVGKTVIALETVIQLKRKYGYDNVKCYYFRLADESVKALLRNNAHDAVDPYLVNKYNLKISRSSNRVLDDGKPLFDAFALSTAAKLGKGINLYDCNFFKKFDSNGKRIKTFIVTIWDEFLPAEGVERRQVGDPVSQYLIYREAIYRDEEAPKDYDAVYNFLCANNVSECAAITCPLYNYIPDPNNGKRTVLKRKHAFFWNVPITEKYIEKRSKSINAAITDFKNDKNYTIIARDLSLVKDKKTRIRKVTALLKFDNIDTRKWFCIYDGKYIRQYHMETVNKELIYSMMRHYDNIYNADYVKKIFDLYDTNNLMYADIKSMALFKAQMKLLKSR